MLNTETNKGAVHIARRMQSNPRELLISVAKANEGASKERLFDLWVREIGDDEDMRNAVFWYFFINMYAGMTRPANGGAATVSKLPTAAELVEKARKIVLMKHVTPMGKRIEESTFGEMLQCGGWYSRVGKLGKPNQIVGKTITEEQLRKASR